MDRVLLDTDVFSEILKGVDRRIAARATAYRVALGVYTLCVITVVEIVKGLHRLGREDRIVQFRAGLQSTELLTLDVLSSEVAGRIYADLERTGQPIGRADPIIAAIALRHNLALVTGNVGHFERIQKLGYALRLENWRT